MSESSKFETISSFVDNYQLDEKALSNIVKDEQMSDTWSRYHLIGDTLRDELPADAISPNLAVNIASAIAAEPTILAPKRQSFIEKSKANVVKLAKPFGQVAIAASAATLMIMGVQHNVAENDEFLPTQQIVQTIPLGGVTDTVSYNAAEQKQQTSQLSKQAYIEQQRHFQSLFADHQQQLKFKQLTANKVEDENTSKNKTEVAIPPVKNTAQ